MSDAPEKIYMDGLGGFWKHYDGDGENCTQYVRADLHEQLEADAKATHLYHEGHEAQMEALRAENAELKAVLKEIADRRLKSIGHRRCVPGNCDFDGIDCPAQQGADL